MFYKVYASLCEERGEKPYSVAKNLGLKSADAIVNKWKKGSTPRGETLSKVADYFNVPVEYLLSGDEHYRQKEKQPADPAGLSEWERTMLSVCHDLSEDDRAYLLKFARGIIADRAAPGSSGDK